VMAWVRKTWSGTWSRMTIPVAISRRSSGITRVRTWAFEIGFGRQQRPVPAGLGDGSSG
jgi:hypothetical protein